MAGTDKIPYPPSPDPDDVPDDLTAFPQSYVTQETLLLVAQLVFLASYLALVGVAGFLAVWLGLRVGKAGMPLGLVYGAGAVLCGLLFLFLGKGLFRRTAAEDVPNSVEITEDDQPTLFAFIRRVCEEAGAEEPRKVLVVPEVNAMVIPRVTMASLVVTPPKDLVIGLGLVNCVNLSEFKNILAHEFGHFTQQVFVQAYGVVVDNVIVNLLKGQDGFDKLLDHLRQSDGGAAVAAVLGAGPRAVSWVLFQTYKLLDFARYELRREREFHADLVGVSVAGSDAATHALLKTRFGDRTFGAALAELRKAADHRLYTADAYYHMHAAAPVVRRRERDPNLGLPPTYAGPWDGKKVQVFDPDGDYEGQTDHGHPNDYEREENMKARFVPCPIDERSPWVLFEEPAALRERMTRKLYRAADMKLPRGAELADPRAVQKFIDDENQETTYDPRYDGVYDERMINPGDLDELNELIRKEPWPDDRLANVYGKLYHDVRGRADEWLELIKERRRIIEDSKGGGSRRARRLLREVDDKLERSTEWFDSLDRRAYLVFVQMAYRVGNEYYYDLINRYRFHLAVQGMFKAARHHQAEASVSANGVFGSDNPHPDDVMELMHTLRAARAALKKILREARELDLPAMKNFDEGDRLADFLLDQDIVPELPETYVKGKWVGKLLGQLDQVMSRCNRLHFKSLGGILRLQEEIAAKFLAGRPPAVPAVPVVALRPAGQ
jgi:Zn-dependent protease with chaperone function